MDGMKCAKIIEGIIAEIGTYRKAIEGKGIAKAKTMKAYDKALAIAIAELGHNPTYELDGKTYKQPLATLRNIIAKGLVADFLEEMEIAKSDYKAVISNLEALEVQQNGYQSINRWLDSI